jgi:hypothetical protein
VNLFPFTDVVTPRPTLIEQFIPNRIHPPPVWDFFPRMSSDECANETLHLMTQLLQHEEVNIAGN